MSGLTLPRVSWPVAALLLLLQACSSKDSELTQFIETTKSEPGGRVEPIPELKPYDSKVYDGNVRRSPFMPGGGPNSATTQVRPVTNRNREFLEAYPLDTLRMVGTIKMKTSTYGMLQITDGRIHRVVVGNYLGQNDGKITKIDPNRIYVTEVVPDGLGGYMERAAEIPLTE
jgi:type IV pilus assembly protein PilP